MAGADALEDAETGSETVAMYECECECGSLSDQHAPAYALDRRARQGAAKEGLGGKEGER
jgi:hypothetical protein